MNESPSPSSPNSSTCSNSNSISNSSPLFKPNAKETQVAFSENVKHVESSDFEEISGRSSQMENRPLDRRLNRVNASQRKIRTSLESVKKFKPEPLKNFDIFKRSTNEADPMDWMKRFMINLPDFRWPFCRNMDDDVMAQDFDDSIHSTKSYRSGSFSFRRGSQRGGGDTAISSFRSRRRLQLSLARKNSGKLAYRTKYLRNLLTLIQISCHYLYGDGFVNWAMNVSNFVYLFVILLHFFAQICLFSFITMCILYVYPECIHNNGNGPLKQRDAFVLSWTTYSTVGYGHIAPSVDPLHVSL